MISLLKGGLDFYKYFPVLNTLLYVSFGMYSTDVQIPVFFLTWPPHLSTLIFQAV